MEQEIDRRDLFDRLEQFEIDDGTDWDGVSNESLKMIVEALEFKQKFEEQ